MRTPPVKIALAHEIAAEWKRRGYCTEKELAQLFGVPISTIGRALTWVKAEEMRMKDQGRAITFDRLDEQGRAVRIYRPGWCWGNEFDNP